MVKHCLSQRIILIGRNPEKEGIPQKNHSKGWLVYSEQRKVTYFKWVKGKENEKEDSKNHKER